MICSLSAIGKWFSRFFSFYIGLFIIFCTPRFANFARGKWSNHDSKNCSEIRTVTWSVIWLWKLKFSIFVCLFVYLFVCTSRFANFARGKWSNHNSKNCSEIRAVTPFWIWLWNFQFETFIFFTTLYCWCSLWVRLHAFCISKLGQILSSLRDHQSISFCKKVTWQ